MPTANAIKIHATAIPAEAPPLRDPAVEAEGLERMDTAGLCVGWGEYCEFTTGCAIWAELEVASDNAGAL